jgi:Fungal Zn(2)-Cys(6) binuclear cluster domain/Fungal specific transcription factor domain
MDNKTLAGVESGKKRRRPHTKSRGGCQTCKKLRIKCDEGRPQCRYCLTHFKQCLYSIAMMPDESDELHGSDASGLNLRDLQLLYHYQSCIASLLAFLSPQCEEVWMSTIPQMAFKMDSVMHSLLGLSAAHKLEFYRESADSLTQEVATLRWLRSSHFEAASNAFQQAVLTFNSEQGSSVPDQSGIAVAINSMLFLLAAILGLSDVSLLRENQPGSENDIFTTANNAAHIVKMNHDLVLRSRLQPIIEVFWSEPSTESYKQVPVFKLFHAFCISRNNEKCSASSEDTPQKFELDLEDCRVYTQTLELVQALLWRGWDSKNYLSLVSFYSVVSNEFLRLLRQHRPMALLILIHFNAIISQCTAELRSSSCGMAVSDKLKLLLNKQWRPYTSWTDPYIKSTPRMDTDRFHSNYLSMLQAPAPKDYYELGYRPVL